MARVPRACARAARIEERAKSTNISQSRRAVYVTLVMRMFDDWKDVHGADFPCGDGIFVDLLRTSATRASEHVQGLKGLGRDVLRNLVYLMGMDKYTWARAGDAKVARWRQKYFSTTRFDPTKERYAVYEDCLTSEQVDAIYTQIIAPNATPRHVKGELVTGEWVPIINKAGQLGGSCRFQLYCARALKRAGVDLLRMLKDKGILTSRHKESDDPRGASIIYCMTPHGSSKAKRQGWHADFADRFDGSKHLSVIVALSDDIKLPSRGGRSLSDKIPAGERATDFVPIPKGACIIFRGDHMHAGMRGTGCQQFRLHMYLAEVKRKTDVLKEPNRVYFRSCPRRRAR